MSQNAIKNPRRIFSSLGGDATLPSRVTTLENNEYKITYYEVVSGASGSLTVPSQATINAGEFGLSGNAILSKIDGSNKPTFESPKTSGGVIVTASLTVATGAWTASGTYTDTDVALIYSIKIKAIYYGNLTYANIIETVADGSAYIKNLTSDAQAQLDSKGGNLLSKINTAIAHTGTVNETILNSSTPISGFEANDFIKFMGQFSGTNNANTKIFRVYVNTSHSLSGATILATYSMAGSASGGAPFGRNMVLRNALNVNSIFSTTTSLLNDELAITGSNDTAVNYDFTGTNYLVITGQLASAADTMNIKWFRTQRQR